MDECRGCPNIEEAIKSSKVLGMTGQDTAKQITFLNRPVQQRQGIFATQLKVSGFFVQFPVRVQQLMEFIVIQLKYRTDIVLRESRCQLCLLREIDMTSTGVNEPVEGLGKQFL